MWTKNKSTGCLLLLERFLPQPTWVVSWSLQCFPRIKKRKLERQAHFRDPSADSPVKNLGKWVRGISRQTPFVFIVLRVYLATAICHLKVLQASLGWVCFFFFVAAIGSFSDIACLTLCYIESSRVSHANVNVFICSLQFLATGITAKIKAPLNSKSNYVGWQLNLHVN